jgi:hypothetical protein
MLEYLKNVFQGIPRVWFEKLHYKNLENEVLISLWSFTRVPLKLLAEAAVSLKWQGLCQMVL